MPLDTNIPLQAQSPQFNPLQMALQAAQFRAYNANGLAAQQQFAANQATSRAYQQAVDPVTGQLDTNKLSAALAADPDAAYNYATTMKNVMDARQAQQTYDKGAVELNNSQRDNYANGLKFFTQQFATVDPKDPNAAGKIMQIGADAVTNGHIAPAVYKAMVNEMPDDPTQWPQFLQQKLASFQDAGAQLGSITPKPTQVDTGGSLQYVDTNPITHPGIVGTSMNKTLSPETASSPVQVMGPGNTPGVVPRGEMWNVPPLPNGQSPAGAGASAPMPSGAPPGGAAPAQGGPAHFVATAPAMGVQDSNAGTVKTMNDHWDALSGAASSAQRNIGLANNIQHLADTANTGFGSDRTATVNGLLSAFGVKSSGNTAADNDLLNKNIAQLNLSSLPGGTDAAKALQAAATPGAKMQKQAIKDAAQYIVGVNQMSLAEQKYLQSYKLGNDAAGYTTAKTNFDSNADPRIWAWASIQNPDQRAAYAKQLQAQDPGIVKKIQSLEQMGILK